MRSSYLKICLEASCYIRFFSEPLNSKVGKCAYRYSTVSNSLTENAGDMNETTVTAESTVNKMKVNKGGDINMASLLGTVTGLKFFPMQSDPSREWCLIFLRTRTTSPYESTVTQNPDVLRIHSCSNRIHVFDRRILPGLRDAKVGDRIFVTGFLSYYNRLAPSESGKTLPKLCALVAQRLVFMGSVPNYTDSNEMTEVD